MEESLKENNIDRTDRQMLKLLQADGRLSNAELAKKVNVSAATCHRKMQRLVDEGYISGFRAMINPPSVARGALVMVGVVLDRSTPESFAAFEDAIKKLNFVLDCGEQLIAFPGVRQIRSFFVMKEVTDNAELDF